MANEKEEMDIATAKRHGYIYVVAASENFIPESFVLPPSYD
jgi:hypothetical protein